MSMHHLHLEPFNCPFTVVTTPEDRDVVLARWRTQAPAYETDLGAVYRLEHEEHTGFLVFLPPKKNLEVIYHEALHLVYEMLKHHGIPASDANQEVMCHMQGYAARLIERECYPSRRKRKRV